MSTTGDPLDHADSLTILFSIYLKWSLKFFGIYWSNFKKPFSNLHKSKAFRSTVSRMSLIVTFFTMQIKKTDSTAHTKTDFKKISFTRRCEKSGFSVFACDVFCSLIKSSSSILNVSIFVSLPYWAKKNSRVLASSFLFSLSASSLITFDT